MLQKNLQLSGRGLAVAALLSAVGWSTSCQDKYDLDKELPPNFATNLMTHLESQGFNTYGRLAKDLQYEDALSGVSLKTLFAADDEAFERFFKNNKWGVKSYEELTLAQKKLLFYGSMLDNSLQVMSLSSTTGSEGPVVGNAMRRYTAISIYDSLPYIAPAEMPDNNAAWKYYRDNNKTIVCAKDQSTAPLMFLTETFLANKRITNDDGDFIFNVGKDPNARKREPGDANVANTYIEEENIRTANGFIHRTRDVVTPLDNMAEIIRTNPNSKIFSRLLERFSAPYYAGEEPTKAYNHEYGTNIDSLFVKLYYAQRSSAGKNLTMPNKRPVPASLTFDPGWNSYYSDDPNATSSNVAMQQNMGVMLVPTDEAMEYYWNYGIGKTFKDFYGEWDSVPDLVVSKLINNCMINSWVNTVPSKFKDVLNSNQDPMHLDKDSILSVELACNGAIYWTKNVFSPTEYVSVSFPALVNPSMKIFYWAIEQLEYRSYLNSLDSYYSFFIPTNDALLCYLDPVKYNGVENELWEFHYNDKATSATTRVWANVYKYNIATGEKGDWQREERDYDKIKDRLEDLLDNHIIVGNKLLKGNTKNGGVIRVKKEGNDIYVQGTLQRDFDRWIKVSNVYDQTSGGNGKTYILGLNDAITESEPIMTTRKSVLDILSEHEEFSMFYELLDGSKELHATNADGLAIASGTGNVGCFRNYNYTVYVPTNESLQKAIEEGRLHTWEEVANLLEMEEEYGDKAAGLKAESYTKQINSFLRAHIQDNLLMLDMDYSTDASIKVDAQGKPIVTDETGNMINTDNFSRYYETAAINTSSNKFYQLHVKSERGKLQIWDQFTKDSAGNPVYRNVLKKVGADGKDLYNLTAREYKLSGNIEACSFAAVHLIDGPLFFTNKK